MKARFLNSTHHTAPNYAKLNQTTTHHTKLHLLYQTIPHFVKQHRTTCTSPNYTISHLHHHYSTLHHTAQHYTKLQRTTPTSLNYNTLHQTTPLYRTTPNHTEWSLEFSSSHRLFRPILYIFVARDVISQLRLSYTKRTVSVIAQFAWEEIWFSLFLHFHST